jgi:predicted ribosomally synthesized peptide with nif11-like leader
MTHEELALKAEAAKSIEELMAIAKENGIEFSEEDAKKYFEMKKNGELPDESLTDVSGGAVYFAGRLIVTRFHVCDHWKCPKCGIGLCSYAGNDVHACPPYSSWSHYQKVSCLDCKYQKYVFPYHLCTHPDVRNY